MRKIILFLVLFGSVFAFSLTPLKKQFVNDLKHFCYIDLGTLKVNKKSLKIEKEMLSVCYDHNIYLVVLGKNSSAIFKVNGDTCSCPNK